MFHIHGLDKFGLMHALIGVACVLLGLGVVLLRKGTAAHRRVGLVYATGMLLLNITALAIYDLDGRFGPFHVLALVSLTSIVHGIFHAWTRWPAERWIHLHAIAMNWSYAGLIAAFGAEIVSRVPGLGLTAGVLVSVGVSVVAGVLIHKQVPRVASRYALPPTRTRDPERQWQV